MSHASNAMLTVEVSEPMKREEDIDLRVRALLNEICPDNVEAIVERLAQVDLHKAKDLEDVVRIIFSRALAEPCHCDTYADMVVSLRTRYPEFPNELVGGTPYSFTRVLLNTCQTEFESFPTSLEPTEEEKATFSSGDLRLSIVERKAKMLACMKFIGKLFLRKLIAMKVIGQIVHDLIRFQDTYPEEHMIECACDLLQEVGYTMDTHPIYLHGKVLVSQFLHRLTELKNVTDPVSNIAVYDERIQFKIQDLIDLRALDWQKKLYITLTVDQNLESDSGGVIVVGLGMGGERIITIPEEPWNTEYETVKKSLTDALVKASKHAVPVFILPDGTMLTEDHHKRTLEELFGSSKAKPARPEPTPGEPAVDDA